MTTNSLTMFPSLPPSAWFTTVCPVCQPPQCASFAEWGFPCSSCHGPLSYTILVLGAPRTANARWRLFRLVLLLVVESALTACTWLCPSFEQMKLCTQPMRSQAVRIWGLFQLVVGSALIACGCAHLLNVGSHVHRQARFCKVCSRVCRM
jgi:hypothetical protein